MRPLLLTLSNQIDDAHGPIIAAKHEPFPILIAIRVKVTRKKKCNHTYFSFSQIFLPFFKFVHRKFHTTIFSHNTRS